MGVLHSFSIKNIFYDKMNFRLFYFHVTISCIQSKYAETQTRKTTNWNISHAVNLADVKTKVVIFQRSLDR